MKYEANLLFRLNILSLRSNTQLRILIIKKTLHNERACISLIFQAQPTGISTVLSTHMDNGCRGFIGPVPPPLWMSSYFVVICSFEHVYMIQQIVAVVNS